MRALPKRFHTITQTAFPVEAWLVTQRNRVDSETAKGLPGGEGPIFLCVASLIWCIMGGLTAIGVGSDGVHSHWTGFATFWLTTVILGFTGSATWAIARSVLTTRLQASLRERHQLELIDGNALAQRAMLITRAVKDFTMHCDRYEQWRKQVDEELIDEDPAATTRYLAFLERAYETLDAAMTNFTTVAERVRREEEYVKAHPELAQSDAGTGLTILLEELKTGIEKPELPAIIADPQRALAHEEALAAIVNELREQAPERA